MQHSALKPDQYIPSYPLYIHMVHTLDKYPVNPVLGDMVKSIFKDYNWLKKELKMDYNENELSSGIPIL